MLFQAADCEPIDSIIQGACWTWLGHVARMHIPALPKLALWGWPASSKAGSKRRMQGSWLKPLWVSLSLVLWDSQWQKLQQFAVAVFAESVKSSIYCIDDSVVTAHRLAQGPRQKGVRAPDRLVLDLETLRDSSTFALQVDNTGYEPSREGTRKPDCSQAAAP